MAELMEVPAVQAVELGGGCAGVGEPAGGLLEQFGGATVGQPGPADDRARVDISRWDMALLCAQVTRSADWADPPG